MIRCGDLGKGRDAEISKKAWTGPDFRGLERRTQGLPIQGLGGRGPGKPWTASYEQVLL